MKILKPVTVEPGDITSNDFTESAAEYDSTLAGQYAPNDIVKVTGTGGGAATATYRKYKCLHGTNNIMTGTTAATAYDAGKKYISVSSATSNTLNAGSSIKFATDPNFYRLAQAFNGASDSYFVIEAPGLLQELPASIDFDHVDAEDYDPTLYPEVWEDIGAVNDYAPFDSAPSSQATRATSATVVFQPTGIITAIALINFSAEVLGIKIVSTGGGTLHDTTTGTGTGTESIDITSAVDGYDDFFSSDEQVSNYYLDGFNDSSYDDITVTVEVSVASGNVGIGQIVVGAFIEMGSTKHGTNFGLQDYSSININTNGTYSITAGNAVENHRILAYCFADYWPEAKKVLKSVRNLPVVVVPDGDDGAAVKYSSDGEGIVMGLVRNWGVRTVTGGEAEISIDMLGLV